MKTPEKAPEKAEPAKAPEAPVITEAPEKAPEAPKAPAREEKSPAEDAKKAPARAEKKAPAKAEKKSDTKGAELAVPASRKELDEMAKKHGVEDTMKALSKVKVVDLRALAREYNGEFGIAGREIRNANKKVLIEEFRKFFEK